MCPTNDTFSSFFLSQKKKVTSMKVAGDKRKIR